ncbi:MAG: hypothetical protein JNJ58_03535 [Chitinophagaceae bacterium]|nr:hypothetical protein [Chitinophagaceae bacterium]
MSLILAGCKESMTETEISGIGMQSCRQSAPFIRKLGFDPSRTAFSSSEKNMKGLAIFELPKPGDTIKKLWQHKTWSQFGYMGSITTDENGNAYTAPIPFVNTLDNPVSIINRIYKVDAQSSELKLFAILPQADTSPGVVPHGVLGLFYDCHGHKLYAASVAGSTMEKENGILYMLDPATGKVLDELKGFDACGVFVGGITGEKKLYFGHARTPNIYTVSLDKEGYFDGKPEIALSLDQLGPRGDDKARRIRYDQYGNLMVFGVEFNFNLAAQSDKPETVYQFGYNRVEKKWLLMKIH